MRIRKKELRPSFDGYQKENEKPKMDADIHENADRNQKRKTKE